MRSFFTALLAAFAVCGLTQITTTLPPVTCDIAWATNCLKNYIDRYGFNSATTGVFPTPQAFNDAVNNYINANGVSGLANGRTWWLQLQLCLGPNALPCIFNDVYLQQIFKTNSTGMDGTYWLITFLEEDFINGHDAYQVISQNYHCAKQVQQHYAAAITQCQTTYTIDVQKDPANVCLYQVFYMTCLQTIYAQTCGSKLGGFVCNEAGIYLRVMNPICFDNPPSNNFCYSLT